MTEGYESLCEATQRALMWGGSGVLLDSRKFLSYVLDYANADLPAVKVLLYTCDGNLLTTFADAAQGMIDADTAQARAREWLEVDCLIDPAMAHEVASGIAEGVRRYVAGHAANETSGNGSPMTSLGRVVETTIGDEAGLDVRACIKVAAAFSEADELGNRYVVVFVRNVSDDTLRVKIEASFLDEFGMDVGGGWRDAIVGPGCDALLCLDSTVCGVAEHASMQACYGLKAAWTRQHAIMDALVVREVSKTSQGLVVDVRNAGFESVFVECLQLYGEGQSIGADVDWAYDPMDVNGTIAPGDTCRLTSAMDWTSVSWWHAYPVGYVA